MDSKNMIPSQFYFVRSSTSLGDTLKLMKEKSLSFVLVDDNRRKLLGIFTLKDLMQNFNFLKSGAGLEKPIRIFMTRPVKTIPVQQMHKANQIMAKHNIRHLPVTSGYPEDKKRVIGVLDMESLIKASLREEKLKVTKNKDILVYSPNGALLKFLKAALKKYDMISTDKLWASKLRTETHVENIVHDYDLFFFDIVDGKAFHLAQRFEEYVRQSKKLMICLVTPGLFQDAFEKKAFSDFAKKNRVRVFEKPVNVHDIVFECLY